MKTKDRIIDEALTLFSQNGYDSVSVEQIASAVGIKAPSLYKHYKGKKDIFQAVLDEMSHRYDEQVLSLNMNGRNSKSDVPMFETISIEQLMTIGISFFSYFLHDNYACRFRKMLTIGQFQNKELAQLYSKQYVDDPLNYQGNLFTALIQMGVFEQQNADIMTLHFYAPIFFLLTLCDRQPEREEEAVRLLKEHIIQFNNLYKGENKK